VLKKISCLCLSLAIDLTIDLTVSLFDKLLLFIYSIVSAKVFTRYFNHRCITKD